MADISSINDYNIKDATARAGVTDTVDLMKDTTGWLGGNEFNDDWGKGSSHITAQKDGHSFTLATDNQDQYASYSFFNSEIISGTSKGALFPAGKYVITLNVTSIGDDTANLALRRSVDSIIKKQVLQLGDNVFDIDTNESFYISIFPRFEKTTVTTLSFNNVMMLTAEQYNLNPSYRPYHESVEDTLAGKVSWSDVGKYVGKNRFPIMLAQLKAHNPSGTWSGNVWTLGTMTITVSTDSNGYIEELDFNGSDSNTLFIILLPNTSDNKYAGMILNGCPASGSGSTYQIISRIGKISGDTYISSAEDNGSGATIGTIPDTSTDQMRIYIRIQANYPCNHLKLKPMIRPVGSSADFESYIPDNTELTERVQEINSSISLLDSPAEVGNTGMISIPISDIMQYSDIVVVGYNESDAGGNRFVAVIPTEIDGQFDVGIPFVVKSSTGVGFIVARIASNALSLTFLDNTNTNITTMYVKKIFGRKR